MGCLTLTTGLDMGDLHLTSSLDVGDLALDIKNMSDFRVDTKLDIGDLDFDYNLDMGTLTVDVALICSVNDFDNVLFHVNGPLLVKDGYLLVQRS